MHIAGRSREVERQVDTTTGCETCTNKAEVSPKNAGRAAHNVGRGEDYRGGTEDAEEDRERGQAIWRGRTIG